MPPEGIMTCGDPETRMTCRLLIILTLPVLTMAHPVPPHSHPVDAHVHAEVHDPYTFSVFQRSSRTLHLHGGDVTLSLGDITRGQVHTRLTHHNHGNVSGFPRRMRPGAHQTFVLHDHHYELTLLSLRNELIGNDSAVFKVWSTTHHGHSGLSENQKIEALIEAIAALDGAFFQRNDDWYPPDKAATHLQRKWAWKATQVHSAEDFIRVVATQSSETGQRYRIRLADGQQIDSAQWFHDRLHAVEHADTHHH